MVEKFENVYIDHVPRQQNTYADALASFAASFALFIEAMKKVLIYSNDLYCCKFIVEDSKTPREDLQVKEILETLISVKPTNWQLPYIDFVLYGIFPDDLKEAAAIRRKAL